MNSTRSLRICLMGLAILASGLSGAAQQTPARPPAQQPAQARPPAPQPQMDPERARRLYVSKDPKDHGLGVDFQRQITAKAKPTNGMRK